MKKMKRVLTIVEHVNWVIGEQCSILIYVLAAIILYGVVMRYVFNAPVKWEFDACSTLFLGFSILAGAYSLVNGQFVTMDIVYNKLPLRGRAIVDLVTYLFAFAVTIIIFTKGIGRAMIAIQVMETDMTSLVPFYPLRIAIPIGAFLVLVQLVVTYIRNIFKAAGVKEEL